MSKRGTGGIYLRGTIWWLRYSHHGRDMRESSDSESETVARKVLKNRIQQTGRRGKFIGPAEERLTFKDLTEMIEADYAVNERRSARRLSGSLKNLRSYFALDRVVDISSDRVQAYVRQRRDAKAANATINRELAALKRAFKIAVDAERLSRAPHIAMLEENNARQGFLEHADFLALRQALPPYLRDPITFLYLSGWRVSEMKSLEWRDIEGSSIRLRPEISKTNESRVLPLSGELAEVIGRAERDRRLNCPYVFHRNGAQIRDFRHAWAEACTTAKVGKVLVHDLRRCAIRSLVRAGFPDVVAMRLSGHKTRAVFDRYNVTSDADLKTAIEKRDEYLSARPKKRKVSKLKP